MSSSPARHRKPSRFSTNPSARASARHRKRTLASSLFGARPAVVAAVTGTTLILGAGAAFAVTSWPTPPSPSSARLAEALQDEAAGLPSGNTAGAQGHDSPMASSAVRHKSGARPKPARTAATASKPPRRPKQVTTVAAAAPVYRNPVRAIKGILPERVDMGADFGGAGPIYAIGKGVVTNATGSSAGWPGGGWITYQLTAGPAKGLQVYVAEDVKPTVQVGQTVTSTTVIANMFVGGSGIETGWAMPDASSAESQLPEAGSVSGGGPFPTKIGLNFDSLLIALGAPPGYGYTQSGGSGLLPSSYPSSWASVRSKS